MRTFHFFADSGHGWLRVRVEDLRNTGTTTKISSYSYKKGDYAYLEEDCDAPLFLDAYKKFFGDYQIREHNPVNRSFIRNLQRWN